MRSSTRNNGKKQGRFSSLHDHDISRNFHMEPEFAVREWPWWHFVFLIYLQRKERDLHISTVPGYIATCLWGEGEELFGCWCLYSFLRWTTVGAVAGTQWLNLKARCTAWLELLLLDISFGAPRTHSETRLLNMCTSCRQGTVGTDWENNGEEEKDKHVQDGEDIGLFCSWQITPTACQSLSSDSLTLKPQLSVLSRPHCLKSTFCVSTASPALINCAVVTVVVTHPHA